jgi:hypothetical protein
MAVFAQRILRFLLCRSHLEAKSIQETGVADAPTSKAFHISSWNDLKKEGNLVFRTPPAAHHGGVIVVLLLGSPGIGKKYFMSKVRNEVLLGAPHLMLVPLINTISFS